ncbi:MAG TPA: ABC transporter ATP-binding protein [Methanosarcinales archaeon]|nr:ABC transporter ATP-binding protein [Methanosarcinales archaeon]
MIEIKNLSRDWKEFSLRIDLHVKKGEYFVILGPTASGKTLLLELIAGFYYLGGGSISIDGRDVTELPPEQRDIGFVYQDYSLFPHLNVEENIEFSLKLKKIPTGKRRQRVEEIMGLLGISQLADRYSITLSGGEQQRVALARAIASEPRILLLDEPLSALDNRTQNLLRDELKRIHHEAGLTTIHVTHDQTEAMMLADRIGVMMDGSIVQIGTPEEVFGKPITGEVASFVGVENIIDGRVVSNTNGLATIDAGGGCLIDAISSYTEGDTVRICLRPEDVTITTENDSVRKSSARNSFSGVINQVTLLGAMVRIGIDCEFPLMVLITKRSASELGLDVGSDVVASFKATAVHLIKA